MNIKSCLLIAGIIFSAFTFSGCSSTPQQNSSAETNAPSDPFEVVNRPIWDFTWDYADKYVTRPLSLAYVNNVPTPLRKGLYNVALNLNEPASFINHLLQAKFTEAGKTAGRFVVNSTLGILGLFDPASDLGMKRHEEEFGEVLGSYGVADGPYLVVPVIGPSSVRDEVGDFVDSYYWPLAIIEFWPNLARNMVLGLEQRAALVQQEALINESVDDYEFVKNAYFQNMEFKVFDGKVPVQVDESEEEGLDAYLEALE